MDSTAASSAVVHFDGRPSKRGVGAIDHGSDSDGDIPSKLAEMFAAQNTTIAETNAKLQADVSAGVTKLVEKRVSKVEHAHQELATKVDTLENSQLGLAAEVGILKEAQAKFAADFRVARREAVEREEIESDKFDRPPNPEFLRLSTQKVVSLAEVSKAFGPWLTDVCEFRPDEWKIVAGTPKGKGFNLKFLQVPLTNARMVGTCMSNLKDDEGEFRTFEAKVADGSTTSIRINRDENERGRTQRRMAAVALKAIKDLYPLAANVHIRRDNKKGKVSVFVGSEGICTMDPTSGEVGRGFFLWNNPRLAEEGFDKEAILDKALLLLERPEDNIQWCL